MTINETTLARLDATIKARRAQALNDKAAANSSYVARLSGQGRAKIAQKLGEEAVETIIAAISQDQSETIKEAADLLFHLGILLADVGVDYQAVMDELDRREGLSGLTEKANRNK